MNKNNLKSISKIFILNGLLGILSIPGIFLSMYFFVTNNIGYFSTIKGMLTGRPLGESKITGVGYITASIFIVLIINYFAIKKRKNREISPIILTVVMILGVFTPIVFMLIYLQE